MFAARLRSHRAGKRVVQFLGPFGWGIIVVFGAIGLVANPSEGSQARELIYIVGLGTFAAVLVLRLVVAIFTWPSRRGALIPLTIGIVLWFAGSVALNAAVPGTTFPAPGEWLFVSSYVALSAFLVVDASSRRMRAASAWLDAVILCGAIAALVGGLLLTPFVRSFPEGGIPLLVAILYPLIDVALALVVVTQWALSSRSWNRSTIGLIAGFLAMALADSSLVLNLSIGTYSFSTVTTLLWGAAFMLIVGSAVTPRPPQVRVARPLPGGFLIASFLTAIVLLLIRPEGILGWAIGIPAAVALLATGTRLALALRDSREAGNLLQLTRTDDLTGLPNRRAVLQSLDDGIAADQAMGLMLLGLDGFKEINDTLGHSAGDTVLELVALRIRESLTPSAVLARIGGDEFAILLDEDDELDLMERAQAVREMLMAPANVDGMNLAMRASIGITIREPGDERAADMLRRADVALHEAKIAHSGAELYDPQHDEFSRQRLRMGEELRRALRKGHIVTWYQPKVDAATQLVTGVEALVRWEHPQRGVLAPIEFLPVARRAGLMGELSEIVARQAVADAQRWLRSGLNLNVAFNLAPPELLGGTLLPILYDAIAEADIPAYAMTVEVTEDTFLANPERAREILTEVRGHGLKISIDDYGSGFSSLAYLRDLPLTELKMDRSFVSTVCTDSRSRLIVASTIDMAHALDLRVVAEGVDSAAVTAEVVAMGVDLLQGYHVSPPIPADRVDAWVRTWNEQSEISGPLLGRDYRRDSSAS